MTSNQGGTTTGYYSIAPYRLYLKPYEEDVEFMSGLANNFSIQEIYRPDARMYARSHDFIPTSQNDNIANLLKRPKCKAFLNFIQKYKLQDVLQQQQGYTLFVPLNNVEILETTVQKYGDILSPEDLLRYHLVDYIILPIQVWNQIQRLKTRLENQTITMKNTSVMTFNDEIKLWEDNKIIEYVPTDNGSLYFIDRPLIPNVYSYM
jgi:uncharacterized surface protein with fasciclin (FAS1) repeats